MSIAKHTPWPWSADGHRVKQDLTIIGLSKESGVTIGCAMGGSTSGPYFPECDDEVKANARLFAAAPELLDALQDMLHVMEQHEQLSGSECSIGDKARAAIAKATGSAA